MKNYTPQQLELNVKSTPNPFLELGVKQEKCNGESCLEGGEKKKCQKL